MTNTRRKNRTLAFFCLILSTFAGSAQAADVQWTGMFRVEGYHISNSELGKANKEKSYGLHHLVLRPRIVAADGLTIHSRLDVFNSPSFPNSVLGQVWGSGVENPSQDPNSDVSRTLSHSQRADSLQVNLLYLTYDQEFGSLIVGRAPLHFGLGANLNAGNGMFDHWIENRDLVGYKIVMGNMYLLPMYAKVSEGALASNSDDITDLIVQFQYENPESDLEMGAYYMDRRAGRAGNDTGSTIPDPPITGVEPPIGGPGATFVNGSVYKNRNYGLYVLKDTERYRAGMEVGIMEGSPGIRDGSNREVTMNGFGIATEFEYRPQGSRWKFGSKLGYATGDDPSTTDEYEGYIFNRNYDVAFLLFNHPLGRADFLRTGAVRGHPRSYSNRGVINQPDTEAISNVMYVSPYVHYQWKDQWSFEGVVTTGLLNKSPITGANVDQNLGFEFDFAVNFRPNERVTWVNQVGLLMPGSAFEGGKTNGFDTSFAYGFTTRAAISF